MSLQNFITSKDSEFIDFQDIEVYNSARSNKTNEFNLQENIQQYEDTNPICDEKSISLSKSIINSPFNQRQSYINPMKASFNHSSFSTPVKNQFIQFNQSPIISNNFQYYSDSKNNNHQYQNQTFNINNGAYQINQDNNINKSRNQKTQNYFNENLNHNTLEQWKEPQEIQKYTSKDTSQDKSKQNYITPIKKQRNQFLMNSIETNISYDNENVRSAIGLRVLSQRVKDIVCCKKDTTYLQVADILIEELKDQNLLESNQNPDENIKQEKNVKRRVYDALNVLVAADIIHKQDKQVTCNKNSSQIGKSMKNGYQKQKEIQQTQIKIQEKKEKLKNLVEQNIALMQLQQRNKSDLPFQNKAYQELKKDSIVKFPFILIAQPDKNNHIKMNFSQNSQILHIQSNSQLKLYGDIEVLMKIKFNENILTQNLDKFSDDFKKIYDFSQTFSKNKKIKYE